MNRAAAVLLCLGVAVAPIRAQFRQEGHKLQDPQAQLSQGYSVAISADGNTALLGGRGEVWVYTRSNCVWGSQGTLPLPGYGFYFFLVQLSADGNTALASAGGTAVIVFVRSNGVWTQQGSPLAAGVAGIALSGDGNTAALGLPGSFGVSPEAVVFTRSGGVWTQQGPALTPSGYINVPFARRPIDTGVVNSLALSSDGNTLLFGSPDNNGWVGATWVFTRSGGTWAQQAELTASDATDLAQQGNSVALSGDGNTALIGGPSDNEQQNDGGSGAAWVFTRTGGVWTQQGGKLVARDATPGSETLDGVSASQGWSVALSGDGTVALIAGPDNNNYQGAVWEFTQTFGVWSQRSHKLHGRDVGLFDDVTQGQVVALSSDGLTALVGSSDYGPAGQVDFGSAFVFVRAPYVTASAGNPQSATTGLTFPFALEGSALDINTNPISGALLSFVPPGSGPSAQIVPTSVSTDSTGRADVSATSNDVSGSYTLTLTSQVAGACPATAALALSNVNRAPASVPCVVTNGLDDNSPGSLRYQVAACGMGGIITFLTAVQKVDLSQGQDIQLTQDVTIDGSPGLIIDAHNQSRVFFIFGGNIVLRNLTLRNGLAAAGNGGDGATGGGGGAGMGGGIFMNGGTVTLGNMTLFGNRAEGGTGGFGGDGSGSGGGGGIGFDGGFGGLGGVVGTGGGGGDLGNSGGTALDGSGGGGIFTQGGFGGGGATPSGAGGFGGGAAPGSLAGVFGAAGVNTDGGGGAALGGGIFVRGGLLVMNAVSFNSNIALGGLNGGGQPSGQGKGGALYIAQAATVVQLGTVGFGGNLASDSGSGTLCNTVLGPTASDTGAVCGTVQTGVIATSGSGQSASILSTFANPLVASITAGGNPIAGITVGFSGPTSGASINPASSSVLTGSNGQASLAAVANASQGSYSVTLTIGGAATTSTYSLANTAAVVNLTAVGGSGQTAVIGSPFGTALQAKVTNGNAQGIPNVAVTFSAPASGPSAIFPNGGVAYTDASGVARITAIADSVVGSYFAAATIGGTPVVFSLTNLSVVASSCCSATGNFVDPAPPVDASPASPHNKYTVAYSTFQQTAQITVTLTASGKQVYASGSMPVTLNWGFSPDDDRLVVYSVTSGVINYSVYDLTVIPARQLLTNALAASSIRYQFSPSGRYLLLTETIGTNNIVLQIYRVQGVTTAALVHTNSFAAAVGSGQNGLSSNAGFSPTNPETSFVYAFQTFQSSVQLQLVNLSLGQAAPPVTITAIASFWQFSPCGDAFGLITQISATQDQVDFINPATGVYLAGSGSSYPSLAITLLAEANGEAISYPGQVPSPVLISPKTPCPPQVSEVHVLSRDPVTQNIILTSTLVNNGGTTATNVQITMAKIATTSATTFSVTPLPVLVGTIAAGTAAQAMITFPGSAGTTGTQASVTLSGMYNGGSAASSFGGTGRSAPLP